MSLKKLLSFGNEDILRVGKFEQNDMKLTN